MKQAVIAASALSLLYPAAGIPGYPREEFLDDLVREAQTDIRRCLAARRDGADRLHRRTARRQARPVEEAAQLLRRPEQPRARRLHAPRRRRRSASTPAPAATRTRRTAPTWTTRSCCPRSSGSTSATSSSSSRARADRPRVLKILGAHATGGRRIFVGVTDPIYPRVETPAEVRDRDPRGRAVHRPGAPRLDGRLRLLAVRRRHVDLARHRLRQDPRARRGQRAGVEGAAASSGRAYRSSSRTGVSASFQAASNWARAQAASASFFWASRLFERP